MSSDYSIFNLLGVHAREIVALAAAADGAIALAEEGRLRALPKAA